jgi:hypothetical protein
MSFTYDIPDGKEFLAALMVLLKAKGEKELMQVLAGATCEIAPSSSFSRARWNAYWTEIRFAVSAEKLALVDNELEKKLLGFCDRVMPTNSGYDVMQVAFSPQIGPTSTTSFEVEVEALEQSLSDAALFKGLGADLADKGRQMAEAYFFLYYAENILRLFVEKVGTDAFGDQYFSQFTIPKGLKNGISARKANEQSNLWMSMRGNSELFYLDFKELGDLILNNWTLFESFFPNQGWIKTKIDEMANCRNLVAHNSYIDDHERDVLRLNFKSIIKQLQNYIPPT